MEMRPSDTRILIERAFPMSPAPKSKSKASVLPTSVSIWLLLSAIRLDQAVDEQEEQTGPVSERVYCAERERFIEPGTMATEFEAAFARPRRNTESSGSGNSNSNMMFRRMSAQAMGLEANALCHRSHWVPKSTRSSCSNCRRSFRLWTKKHHCRFCGEVVCRNCSTQRILIQKKTLRSCDACVSVNVQSILELSRRNSTSDLVVESASAGGLLHKNTSSVSAAGRKSDGALLRKSMQQHQLRGKQRGSLSKRDALSTGSTSATSRALFALRSRWRSQLPYVVVVFLLALAGVTNFLTRV